MAEFGILVDMRLIEVGQQMPITLGAGQQALELLKEGLPPPRISPAKELPGLLPGQLEAVQGSPDGLAAEAEAKALMNPADQPLEGPTRRWVGPFYGRGGRCGLGGAHDLTEAGLDAVAKGGRPPVRRYRSASGPWAL